MDGISHTYLACDVRSDIVACHERMARARDGDTLKSVFRDDVTLPAPAGGSDGVVVASKKERDSFRAVAKGQCARWN